MARPRHPNKAIEQAVTVLESLGWTWREVGRSSHAWGRMLCAHNDRSGCQISVWSTPRVPENHARMLLRMARNCPHGDSGGDGANA